jgi:hypothetical protein
MLIGSVVCFFIGTVGSIQIKKPSRGLHSHTANYEVLEGFDYACTASTKPVSGRRVLTP